VRNILWKAYTLLYIVLIVPGIAISFKGSAWSTSDTISSILAFVYFAGLLGFIYRVPILSRGVWRALFWFCIVGLVSIAVLAAVGTAPDGTGAALFSLLFGVPLAVALHRYSSAKNPMWEEAGLMDKAQELGGLFENGNTLKASVTRSDDDTQQTTEVVLTRQPDGYEAKIRRIVNDTEESFSNELGDLVSLVRFVETSTPVRIADFHTHG
jgi:hypothetical protein